MDKMIHNRPRYYNRKGEPIDLLEWASILEDKSFEGKIVAQTTFGEGDGQILVSTVWLGLDHNFGWDGPPLIFETMIFSSQTLPGLDEYQERYSTEEAALEGHKLAVALVEAELAEKRKLELEAKGEEKQKEKKGSK